MTVERRRGVDNMQKKLVINKEIVKVGGRVKVITIKKEDFLKVLKLVKLRILDKEYEALMPPLDDMQKNTIDVNGLAVLMTQYMSAIITSSGNGNSVTPAQMALTTQNGTVTLSYTGSVNINTQGVSVYPQLFEDNGNFVWQYYYVGYDTTNASYTTSKIELYASAVANGANYNCAPPCAILMYTDIVRIAYANVSFTKTSDSYLFIVWLIQFQNVPSYASFSIPTFQNNKNLSIYGFSYFSSYTVYFNNGNCNFTCGGNCPSGGLTGFVIDVQGNSIILEVPVMVGLGGGVSTAEMLICYNIKYDNMPNISGQFTTTLSPPVSGGTFYIALATITIIFQTS
jgi:hypothetical protein